MKRWNKSIIVLLVFLLTINPFFPLSVVYGTEATHSNDEVDELMEQVVEDKEDENTNLVNEVDSDASEENIQLDEEAELQQEETELEEKQVEVTKDEPVAEEEEQVENEASVETEEDTSENIQEEVEEVQEVQEVQDETVSEEPEQERKETMKMPMFRSFSTFSVPSWNITNFGNIPLESEQEKAEALAQSLVGSGVLIRNIEYVGNDYSSGFFQAAEEIIGFEEGIILSTGDVSYVVGPNTQDSVGKNNRLSGDVDLDGLIPSGNTYDATVLEFDFVPTTDELVFEYVFASEEYNEYVNSSFNDVFGFFVNGTNVANIPNTDLPVSINTVNGGNPYGVEASNSEYFRNNDLSDGGGDIDTEMDGLTVVLPIKVKVNPGEYNHIKLAIADVGDGIYDSNVFIRSGSFEGQSSIISGIGAAENIKKQTPNYPEQTVGEPIEDPIDSATGAQVINKNLFHINGAIPLEFNVNYNSLLLDKGTMGPAWTHSYELSLTEREEGLVHINWNVNQQNTFVETNDGSYESPDLAMAHHTLTKASDGSFTLEDDVGDIYEFDSTGKLIKKIDHHQFALNFAYDESGNLAKVTEPISNQSLDFSYNEADLLEQVSHKSGQAVTFSYNEDEQLVKLTDVANETTTYSYNELGQIEKAVASNGNQIFKNTFDEMARVIEQEDAKGQKSLFVYEEDEDQLVTTYTDRQGNTQSFTYNKDFQLVSKTDVLGHTIGRTYDDNGNIISETNENGDTFKFAYDSNGNVTSFTDSLGRTTSFSYDNDNIISITNADGEITSFEYNSRNQITAVTDPTGKSINFTYNDQGFLAEEQSRNGAVIKYGYENGLIVSITNSEGATTNYNYDQLGQLTTFTDEKGYQTNLEYDVRGNVTKITNPLGDGATFTYDSNGNLTSETDFKGNTTTYEYDANFNLVKEINALGQSISYGYDAEDRLTAVTDAKGNKTTLTYDAKGRLTGITNPLGNSNGLAYDGVGNILTVKDASEVTVLQFAYDSVGNLTELTNALGHTESYTYNKLNQLTKSVDPLNNETTFQYDALQQIIGSVDALGGESKQTYDADGNRTSLTDAKNNTMHFEFDLEGQLTSIASENGSSLTYSFDERGLIESIKNGRGQVSTYEYDAAERLIKATEPDHTIEYSYDKNSNITEIQDNLGTIRYTYDALDRVTSYQDVYGNLIQYEYDANGNLTVLTYPNGNKVNYKYDAADQLVEITDWDNRTTTYSYDKNGRLVETIRPNGTVEERIYNEAGQLIQLKDYTTSGEILNDFEYEYNELSNITSKTSNNDLEMNIGTNNVEATYGKANEIGTFNEESLEHDQDGNLVTGLDEVEYEYDTRNRLQTAGDYRYTYDDNNNRIAVTSDDQSKRFVVNPNFFLPQVLMETDETGQVLNTYVYGIGLVGYEGNDGSYYSYHFDIQGNTAAITDMDEKVQARYLYDPFGNIIASNSTVEQPYQFAGQYGVQTDDNGLVYMRARYYNPEMQRFLNQDIVIGNVSESQSLNRYAYSRNNPVMFIDPDGEAPWAVVSGLAGAVINVGSQLVVDVVDIARGNSDGLSGVGEYLGSAVGGFAGGFTLGTTGNPMLANAASSAAGNLTTQGYNWITGAETKSVSGLALDMGTDFLIGYGLDKVGIGDKIADKFVPSAGNFSDKWANKVIKKWKTAFTGKTAKTELYKRGPLSSIPGLAADILDNEITAYFDSLNNKQLAK